MPSNSAEKTVDFRQFIKDYAPVFAFLILVAVNALITRNFLSINTFWNLIIQVFPVMLTSLGMMLVISSGGIDISVGSTMAISAVMCGMVITGKFPSLGSSLLAGIALALLLSILLGLFNGCLISIFKVQPIIATLVLYIGGRGIAQLMNNGNTVVFYNNYLTKIGVYRLGNQIPIQLFVEVLFIAVTAFVVKKTTFGYYMQGIGENEKAARLSGVKTRKILIFIYVICAALAGIAGLFVSARAACADPNTIGDLAEMDAIAAVAIGGTSMNGGKARIVGTIFGALIIQLISIMVNMNNIPYAFARIFKAAIIIIAVYLRWEKRR